MQKFTGNTAVTVVMTGSANDQLSEFDLGIQSITLMSQTGDSVPLVTALEPTEFIHVNGGIEPLVTTTIPQGIYTSATATIGGANFTCITLTPQGGLDTSTFAYGGTPSGNVTVNLPSPITVTGNTMSLSLDLEVVQSASYSSCYIGNGIANYAITPTFGLTASASGGKVSGIDGQVSSIDMVSNSFVLAYPQAENPRTVTVFTGAGTNYQGINSLAGLTVGMFVNLDGTIQPDGSVMSTRIAVEDLSATSMLAGPVLFVSEAEPVFNMWGRQEQGLLYANIHVVGAQIFNFGNANFQVSGGLTNLNNLPFIPSFDGANMVAGQNVNVSTTATIFQGGPNYVPVSTVALPPQTIDGTVSGTSAAGNFTVYSVNLASYDLFPTLAVQQGQTTLLNNPSDVEVYVDSGTQKLNSQQLAPGGTFRFYGLVFNDHGTLRMDCAQVNDGVSVTPAPMSKASMVNGAARVLRADTIGGQRVTSVAVTPAK